MLTLAMAGLALAAAQDLRHEPMRPAVECAEHLTDWRARRGCLNDLLDEAEDDLDAAADGAEAEAREIDLDSGGRFGAEASFGTAQEAWFAYRDAECTRRASLMFLSDESREEIELDCRIALTRARADELRDH